MPFWGKKDSLRRLCGALLSTRETPGDSECYAFFRTAHGPASSGTYGVSHDAKKLSGRHDLNSRPLFRFISNMHQELFLKVVWISLHFKISIESLMKLFL